jgi:hypothetical protein
VHPLVLAVLVPRQVDGEVVAALAGQPGPVAGTQIIEAIGSKRLSQLTAEDADKWLSAVSSKVSSRTVRLRRGIARLGAYLAVGERDHLRIRRRHLVRALQDGSRLAARNTPEDLHAARNTPEDLHASA